MTTAGTAEIQRSSPLTSPLGIAEFVQALVAEFIHTLVAERLKYEGVERRGEPRFPICIPVEATPYDVGGQRARAKFVAVTRDISASGITFLHTASVEEDYWLLEFPRPGIRGIRLVLKVLYRRPIGPLWEIAGRFVTEPTS
jgi:hypothetical protein